MQRPILACSVQGLAFSVTEEALTVIDADYECTALSSWTQQPQAGCQAADCCELSESIIPYGGR